MRVNCETAVKNAKRACIPREVRANGAFAELLLNPNGVELSWEECGDYIVSVQDDGVAFHPWPAAELLEIAKLFEVCPALRLVDICTAYPPPQSALVMPYLGTRSLVVVFRNVSFAVFATQCNLCAIRCMQPCRSFVWGPKCPKGSKGPKGPRVPKGLERPIWDPTLWKKRASQNPNPDLGVQKVDPGVENTEVSCRTTMQNPVVVIFRMEPYVVNPGLNPFWAHHP